MLDMEKCRRGMENIEVKGRIFGDDAFALIDDLIKSIENGEQHVIFQKRYYGICAADPDGHPSSYHRFEAQTGFIPENKSIILKITGTEKLGDDELYLLKAIRQTARKFRHSPEGEPENLSEAIRKFMVLKVIAEEYGDRVQSFLTESI